MELEIFSDETQFEDKNGKEYLGITCLFLPTSYKCTLSNKLSKLRCLNKTPTKWSWNYNDCKNECKEKYPNINNFEIHSTKIEKFRQLCQKPAGFNISKNNYQLAKRF